MKIDKKYIKIQINQTIFEAAEKEGIIIPSSCKKQGKCKECLVEIKTGMENLNPKTQEESHLMGTFRLACQAKIEKEGKIECQTLKRSEISIEEDSSLAKTDYEFDPAVTTNGKKVFIDHQEIDKYQGTLLGLAIDIGTTTVVLKLVDLENAKILKTSSFENPQRYAGTNVMSRIEYDTLFGKKELKRILNAHLAKAILSLTEKPEFIYEVVIGGNTTMRDLFFGLDVASIGQTPYLSITELNQNKGISQSTAIVSIGKKMHLPICSKARVYGLPLIGSHVGADTTATLMAIDFDRENEHVLIMDIGTNTEIVIGNKNNSFAASSPSGPAFEGGGITFGMPALQGAIEKIKITNDDIEINIVGNGKAVGICGSGLIDALGELKRTEKINEVGRFEDDDLFVIEKESNIYITENDINLLAQTKGANAAALNILVKELGIEFDDIQKFYLAGGFGKHIDLEASIRIGLLPDIDRSKFIQIGNAAMEGLVRALFSKSKRDYYEKFIKTIKTVNLESDPDFFDHFVNGCQFIPIC